MPYINLNITRKLTPEMKEEIKKELGKELECLSKPERWLMIDIEDDKDIWFAGKKLEDGAFVDVRLFGDAGKSSYEKMTSMLCDHLLEKYSIPKENVYVTFTPVQYWGWNGMMF